MVGPDQQQPQFGKEVSASRFFRDNPMLPLDSAFEVKGRLSKPHTRLHRASMQRYTVEPSGSERTEKGAIPEQRVRFNLRIDALEMGRIAYGSREPEAGDPSYRELGSALLWMVAKGSSEAISQVDEFLGLLDVSLSLRLSDPGPNDDYRGSYLEFSWSSPAPLSLSEQSGIHHHAQIAVVNRLIQEVREVGHGRFRSYLAKVFPPGHQSVTAGLLTLSPEEWPYAGITERIYQDLQRKNQIDQYPDVGGTADERLPARLPRIPTDQRTPAELDQIRTFCEYGHLRDELAKIGFTVHENSLFAAGIRRLEQHPFGFRLRLDLVPYRRDSLSQRVDPDRVLLELNASEHAAAVANELVLSVKRREDFSLQGRARNDPEESGLSLFEILSELREGPEASFAEPLPSDAIEFAVTFHSKPNTEEFLREKNRVLSRVLDLIQQFRGSFYTYYGAPGDPTPPWGKDPFGPSRSS